MRIGPSLILTSRQTLAMTPQLQQAIKLLQFSHLELAAFIQQELEKNPLLQEGAPEDGPTADDDGPAIDTPTDTAETLAAAAPALAEADAQGVTGKAITPFLLGRIKALTGGQSLATNIALVKHNAVVGARLARALQN